MDFENVRRFLGANHREEINTFQRDGAAQASVVVCGAFHEDVVFVSVMGDSATIRNLRPRPPLHSPGGEGRLGELCGGRRPCQAL